ncbi:MAG: hypothetical protein AB4352_10760 [Hormoscilla sp.]
MLLVGFNRLELLAGGFNPRRADSEVSGREGEGGAVRGAIAVSEAATMGRAICSIF